MQNFPLDSDIRFTSEEITKFERRYENGFDISSDKRYNAWLKSHGLSGKYHLVFHDNLYYLHFYTIGVKKITESAEQMLVLSPSAPSSPLRSSTPSDSSSTKRLDQASGMELTIIICMLISYNFILKAC